MDSVGVLHQQRRTRHAVVHRKFCVCRNEKELMNEPVGRVGLLRSPCYYHSCFFYRCMTPTESGIIEGGNSHPSLLILLLLFKTEATLEVWNMLDWFTSDTSVANL
jgi:hypothetical protein